MDLRKYIREMVESELAEMARISTNIKIGDSEKFEAAKELYAGRWYADLLDFVEEAGEVGIPQPELARMLGKSGMQAINPIVRDFVEAGILTKGDLSMAKKEKPEPSGIKGRPTSEKTLMAKAVNSKMEADANYEPTEEEMAMLGPEFVEKLKMRVKGLLRRGRPVAASKAKDGMMAAMKNVGNEDVDSDGDVDDEDLDIEDIQESDTLNESFIRMQKLAGLITETQYNQKRKVLNEEYNLQPIKSILSTGDSPESKMDKIGSYLTDTEEGLDLSNTNLGNYVDGWFNSKKDATKWLKQIEILINNPKKIQDISGDLV
jgi:hypothetical protein